MSQASRLIRLAALAGSSALALAVAVPGGRARADLEVTLPPGTPGGWTRELPERPPRFRSVKVVKEAVPEKEKGKGKEKGGGTTVREKENIATEVRPQPELGSGTYLPMYFSGVLTADLPFHVPWVKRQGELTPRVYPPAVTDDLYWTAQAAFLRRLLHPAMVPDSEVYWYLVSLGGSAREVALGAKAERFLEPLASAVEAAVGVAPTGAHEAPAGNPGDTAEQRMLVRLAKDELMNGDPYSLDPTYAGRLLSLGEDGLDALLACVASEHVLLRRNAIALLGNYSQPRALEALRKAFREDKDAVARTRALFHLARLKDVEVAPDLVNALGAAGDRRLPPLAAYALGAIEAEDAVPPLVRAIEGNPEDFDLVVAATVALARAAAKGGGPEKEAIAALRKLEESLRQAKPRFVEDRAVPRPAADIPDVPELKNRMLLELATAALARLGDREGTARLKSLVEGRYDDPKNPVGHANANGPERASQCEALKFVCPSTHELLVEAWGSLGADGAARLRQVIEHAKTNERLRMAALRAPAIAKDKRLLMDIAIGGESAGARSLALRLLTNADEKAGIKVAESILAVYASGKPMSKANPKGDMSVISALEVLFRAKKLKLAALRPALARAIAEFEYVRPEITAEGMKPFRFSPPILDTIVWMIGALAEKDGFALLKKVAADPKLASRAEAALAMSRYPGEATVGALADLLDDEDPWVRYSAFLAVRTLTGVDEFADWLYGNKGERQEAVAKYRELAKAKK